MEVFCLHVRMCSRVPSTLEGQKSTLGPTGTGVMDSYEPRPSGKAASAPNHWAISSIPLHNLLSVYIVSWWISYSSEFISIILLTNHFLTN